MRIRLVKSVPVLLTMVFSMLFLGGCGDGTWEKHIVKEEIFLPGLEEEYDLLFLTDTHVVVMSEEDTTREKASAGERKEQFQNEEGVYSEQQFGDWMDYAKEMQPDAVLLGGDIIDSPSAGNVAFLEMELGKLQVPYLYTPGNHDWTYEWDYMTENAVEEYLPRLEQFMNDSPALQSLDVGELRIIAVDNSTNQVAEGILEEYEKLLQTEQKVIVMLHVPLITQSVLTQAKEVWESPVVLGGGNYGGIYPNETSQKFLELTTAADSPVELVLAGHVHFYDKDYIDGEKKVLQIVGAAGYQGQGIHLHLSGE
ncbi:MAG: metallophosphoesterase [Lachnospiraceae bacterium]|nr:metallophosphoesterase [Lachnospiraceae bacterium]